MIEISVKGIEPRGQPRARAFACRTKGGGVRARMYSAESAGVSAYREALWHAAQKVKPEKPIEGPVKISAVYRLTRPKGHFLKDGSLRPPHMMGEACTKRPDIDNLDKLVMDTLTACGYWIDDSQIVSLHSYKLWATDNTGASVEITEVL